MDRYARKHLTDSALLSGFKRNVGNERGSLADVLADIAEIEERKLYVPAAHPSMVSYMVHEMRFTEQAAYKRLRAARTAVKFPTIFRAVAAGRLHLSDIILLTAHLTPENVDQLLEAAANSSKTELERMLAGRIESQEGHLPLDSSSQLVAKSETQLSPGTVVATHTPCTNAAATQQPDERSDFHCQMDREGREALEYARALLSHAIPSGDMGRIVSRAAKALVREVEKEMFGSTDRPGKSRGSSDPRHIPFAVKREVWKRDGGQCSFHSEHGKRCPSRDLLQFHHIVEVALGGTASLANISLRCRAHNQYESERTFGKQFMQHKREQAQQAASRRKAEKEAEREAARAAATKRRKEKEAKRAAQDALDNDELMPGLRGLGCTIERARSVLATVGPMEGFPMQVRLKRCLSMLAAPHTKIVPNGVAVHGTA